LVCRRVVFHSALTPRCALQVSQKERGAGDWSNYVPPSQTLAAIAARAREHNGTVVAAPQLRAAPQPAAAAAAEAPPPAAAGHVPLPPLLRERLAARGIITDEPSAPAAAPEAAPAPAAPPPLPPGWVRHHFPVARSSATRMHALTALTSRFCAV
jgi:hypothetical protein